MGEKKPLRGCPFFNFLFFLKFFDFLFFFGLNFFLIWISMKGGLSKHHSPYTLEIGDIPPG